MKRKLTAFLLAFALIAGLLPGFIATPASAAEEESVPVPIVEGACDHGIREDAISAFSARPGYGGKLIDITPQRVEDTFDYLDEMYVQKHPEAALLVNTGTEEDRKALKTLAEKITEDCKTDTEKANAIDAWLQRNINYYVNTSAYASDTFYDRVGNCLSYANLMQFLLRSLGIPAVVGDGWRGDMAASTVDLFNYEGHAWCFVRLNGEWVMYDPLWLSGGTTDRDYMAKWVYFDTVEFVTPASDSENLPPEAYDKPKAYYTDGRVYCWSEFHDDTLGVLTNFVNNQGYTFVTNQDEPETGISDGWEYLHSDYDQTLMSRGDVYCDSWISYGEYTNNMAMCITYAHANGMAIDGAVMTLDGQDYLMSGSQCEPILADKDDYSIMYGLFTLKPGYTGQFLGLPWQDGIVTGNIVTWENLNPEVATVDDNGIITCHAEGYAEFKVTLKRLESNGTFALLGACYLQVQVSGKERIPDYSDTTGHTHSYTAAYVVEPTCVDEGYTLMSCACGDAYTADHTSATGVHAYLNDADATCEVCGYVRVVLPEDEPEQEGVVSVYRLYNPYTQEHLFTSSKSERNQLITIGWHLDGTAWKAPTEGEAVYRLYNPYDDWHIYSTSQDEIDMLTPLGWVVDGVVFLSDDAADGLPIYRLFNPYETKNYHLLTASKDEADWLASLGWKLEGIAMFGKK